jgi:HlyD family secretion protein
VRLEEIVRFHKKREVIWISGLFAAASLISACAHPPANTYQGYVEGRFVYVASPESGRLEQLSVTRHFV